jgi:ammonium transporter, Amt family
VAGSLAERTFVDTYMFFALLMTGFVFPVAASWIWGGGWLKVLGFKDFAGAGVVHLLGGICGMVGTIILGPRLGVYRKINLKLTSFDIPKLSEKI